MLYGIPIWAGLRFWLLGKHPSNPYNPLIANAFFRASYIESWGRGIEKFNRECKELRGSATDL